MKKLAIIAALTATVVLVNSAQAAQFVVDGDFSQLSHGVGRLHGTQTGATGNTTAAGWTTAGNLNFVFADATTKYQGVSLWDAANKNAGDINTWDGAAPGGSNFLALEGSNGRAAVSQTITGLTIGKTYAFSYDYAFSQQKPYNGDTTQNLTTTFGNTTYTTPTVVLASHTFSGWRTYTGTLTATSVSEVLSFLAYGDKPLPPFALVTNVEVAALPEPATWAMMLIGFGAIGFAARRRQNVSATYA